MARVQILRRPILPVIEIKKNDGGIYTYNHFTNTYHFRPHSITIKPPVDKKGGSFEIQTNSLDASNSQMRTFLSNIEEGNEILFYIGKTNASKVKVLLGVIESIETDEPLRDYTNIKITGPDWGSDILKHRLVNGSWIQKKLSNGIDLDPNDNSTLISQIVSDLITNPQSYPVFDGITVQQQGVVYNPANVIVPTLQIPQFEANMEFVDDKLAELDDYGYALHYVDPDKNFVMKPIFSSVDSGVLLVDDYEDAEAINWSQDKVGLLQQPMSHKTTVENHLRRMFGLGADLIALDQKQETVSHSTNLDANYLAMKFRPIYSTCHSIGLYLGKVGTPPSDLIWWLVEDNGNKPGAVVLRTLSRNAASLLAGGDWTYFPIGEKLNVASDYWIVIAKIGDATNTYRWFRNNGSSHTNAFSADNVSWTVQGSSYGFAFRQYTSSPLLHYIPGINTASQKHFHEDAFRRPDINTKESMIKYLTAISASRFARKEIVKATIYAPDTLLLPGQAVRVRKTKAGRLVDKYFVLGDMEYVFQATDDQATGPFKYSIEASLFTSYA